MAKGAYIGVNNVARKIKKGYVGIENFTKRNLPAGYTQVEYIEATGSQYIDAELAVNKTDSYEYILDALLTNGTFGGANGYLQFDGSISGGKRVTIRVSYDGATHVTTVYVNGVVSSTTDWTSSYSGENVKIGILKMGNAGNAWYTSDPQIGKVYSCQIKKNGSLVRDYVPTTNASGTAGLHDMVNGKFYINAGTGTFAVGPTYKGIARKIKKAYIGIGGVARPCWSGGELTYYGTVTALTNARYNHAATAISEYALFAGGTGTSNALATVQAYSKSLVGSSTTPLSAITSYLAATTVGGYALFAGGNSGSTYRKTVSAYDGSLARQDLTNRSTARSSPGATTVGGCALFAGGAISSTSRTASVEGYNESFTKTTPTNLSTARSVIAATTVGSYAIFAGGYGSSGSRQVAVDAYNTSLSHSTPTALSIAKMSLGAATVGDYALFAGGTGSGLFSTVDAYDKSLTKTTVTSLSVGRSHLAATSVGDFALFAGGADGKTSISCVATVDVYDKSLTRTTTTAMSSERQAFAATTVGNYALFGGGKNSSGTVLDAVDAYTVA